MKRRNFLKVVGAAGAAGAACATGVTAGARAKEPRDDTEFVGVLVDTTRCIGCRACEKACSEEHGNYVPDIKNDGALENERSMSERQWTVVNRYETEKGEVFVKKQCMHCWQPACAAACLTNAMYKTKEGPVIWRSEKCMGCRYCMISCPFDVPKFEYDSWNPKIQKCTMCAERIDRGQKPACVEACPTDALMFGPKRELIEVARVRIYNHPTRYVRKIYGEHEVGGTGYIYLSEVPFEQLGFRTDLGERPYPEYTKEFLYAVPMVLFGVPAFLLGLNALAGSNEPELELGFDPDDEGESDE